MDPSQHRQFLVFAIPTVAVLLSYFWYRRKRTERTDPKEQKGKSLTPSKNQKPSTSHELNESPRIFSRSDSAPIDIVIPPKLKATKSNPVVISDEDLDLEIEKIKSMRYGGSFNNQQVFKQEKSPKKTEVMAQTLLEEPQKREIVIKAESVKQMMNRQNSERDSANHSPADVILASPSLSSISDNHSEGSNDSGKGGSDVVTPPPSRSSAIASDGVVVNNNNDGSIHTVYEFVIPQQLVGKLIGKHGSSVANIRDKTGAHVVVTKHPSNTKLKVCCVEGTKAEIDSALKLIREKFPLKRFPEVTLEQVEFITQAAPVPIVPDQLHLKLIAGINNDTTVSCIVAPNHLFLQQPTHPSFPNLNVLNGYLNACYAEAGSPPLPTPTPENTICVAKSGESWFRAMIVSSDEASGTAYVKFLDYGGFGYIDVGNLRQIRTDFMLLPFQAAECFLANIRPLDEGGWREEAYTAVAEMTKGAIIYTQVTDYTEVGTPLVHCYLILGPDHVVFLNQELVKLGHAEWVDFHENLTAA